MPTGQAGVLVSDSYTLQDIREDKRSAAFLFLFCFPQAKIKVLQGWGSNLQHLQGASIYLIFWHAISLCRDGGDENEVFF